MVSPRTVPAIAATTTADRLTRCCEARTPTEQDRDLPGEHETDERRALQQRHHEHTGAGRITLDARRPGTATQILDLGGREGQLGDVTPTGALGGEQGGSAVPIGAGPT